MSVNVLLIDDDRELVEMLVFAFRRAGLTTTTAYDVASGIARFDQDHPDLVVLDLHLGASNGFDFLQQVRRRSQVPIIVLTALASEDDKVKGLSMGADDYVTKPFSHRELLTRIQMRLRRAGQPAPRTAPDVIRVGDIELDAKAHTVQRAGQPVNLTVTEFRLLHHLLVNAGQVVRTEDIMRHVWGDPDPTDSDVLRVTLHRLRRKLGETGSAQGILRTVAGVGVLLQGERIVEPADASGEEASIPAAEASAAPSMPPTEPVSPPTAAASAPPPSAPPVVSAPPIPARQFTPREVPPPPILVPSTGGWIERDGQDRLRLRFRPDPEIESVLFVMPSATLESYDPATEEVIWTMPARGDRAWDVFDIARQRGFIFADDIDIPAPAGQGAPAVTTPPSGVTRVPEPVVDLTPPPPPREAVAPTASALAPAPPAPAPRTEPPQPERSLVRPAIERAGGQLERVTSAAVAAGQRGRAAIAARAAMAPAAPAALAPAKPAAAPIKIPTAIPAAGRPKLSELGAKMRGSAQVAAMFLGVTVVAALVSIWAEAGRVGLLNELQRVGEVPISAFSQSQARRLLLAVVLLLLYFASAIAFLVWINRSYSRLQKRGVGGLRYSPMSAVIWSIVPIAFFFVPRRVVTEVHHANAVADGGRVERRRSVPFLISAWWTVFILFAISSALTGISAPSPQLPDLYREAWTNIFSDTLAIAAAVLGIVTIVSVETREPAPRAPKDRGRSASRAP